jgi:hypothetical protein
LVVMRSFACSFSVSACGDSHKAQQLQAKGPYQIETRIRQVKLLCVPFSLSLLNAMPASNLGSDEWGAVGRIPYSDNYIISTKCLLQLSSNCLPTVVQLSENPADVSVAVCHRPSNN